MAVRIAVLAAYVVLVAVITRPEDLALARDAGWYRLPEPQAARLPSPISWFSR